MRRSNLNRFWPLGLILACALTAHGQSKNLPVSPANAAKAAAEASRVIERAKANREMEAARTVEARAPLKGMDAIVAQSKGPNAGKPSFAERAKEAETEKRFQDALSRVAPEGKAILAQSGSTPSLRAPDDSAATTTGRTKASPLTSDGPGPKPQPLKPTPLTPVTKPPLRTVIDANRAFFDPDSGFGVFVDDVVLDHPEFDMTADELEIYMNKEEANDKPNAAAAAGANGSAPGKEAAPSNGPTAGELAQQGAAESKPGVGEPAPSQRKVGGNIKSARARGRKVLITKLSPEGIPQTGIGREAVYDGATGDMILRGWPQIQKGNNLTVAKEPTTYFVIKANGHFHAEGGRAQTIIDQEGQQAGPGAIWFHHSGQPGPTCSRQQTSGRAAVKKKKKSRSQSKVQAPYDEVPPIEAASDELAPPAEPAGEDIPMIQAASAAAPVAAYQQVVTEDDFFSKQQASYDASADGETLLYTRGLVKIYDGRTVVDGVDIEVRRGEIVGLLGPNGAGKTTSFYMIVGLVQPNGGQVFFDDKEVTSEPMFHRARLGMGYLPQEESIFRKLTVRENILAVMETQDFAAEEREAQCQGLMEKFGIDHVADNLALTLSGGEKRRLTIARSLVTEPKLIMLDEPFSGVDPLAVEDIQKIILMLKSVGLAILITDHNVRETLGIVDRAYLIHEGKVLLHGPREYIVNHPLARERYLGENFSM